MQRPDETLREYLWRRLEERLMDWAENTTEEEIKAFLEERKKECEAEKAQAKRVAEEAAKDFWPEQPVYLCDNLRHLVCLPYSIPNLHAMARELGIKRCWFHKNHYDIPKNRIGEICARCVQVRPRVIVGIIRGQISAYP